MSETTLPESDTTRAIRSGDMPARRQARILEMLRDESILSVVDLAERLSASVSTIRRDLDHLTENGYVERQHGGAVYRPNSATQFEPAAAIHAETGVGAKRAIAEEACQLVKPRWSVLFDSGSTVRFVAAGLARRNIEFTAVTNDLETALMLSHSPQVQTVVMGGRVIHDRPTLIAQGHHSILDEISADIAFIGVHSISGDGFSETSLEVAAVKRMMLSRARIGVVVADSRKFAPPSFARICGFSDVSLFMTDSGAPKEGLQNIHARGGQYRIVEVDQSPPSLRSGGTQSDAAPK